MKIIAHRTISAEYPPNSIESLLFLVEHGILAVEFDVCKSAGGRLVVAHPGIIAKEKLESACLLTDFLQACNSLGVDVFIDVKFTDRKFDLSFLNSVMQAVFKARMERHSVIVSNSKKALSQFRGIIRIGYITPEVRPEFFCLYDVLLIPMVKVQDDIMALDQWRAKLVITEVGISNLSIMRMFHPYALMTDNAVEIQALINTG
ncbi:MAG: glycerophosphodiester phosphodiesterase [Dehalococcoidales bacterium]